MCYYLGNLFQLFLHASLSYIGQKVCKNKNKYCSFVLILYEKYLRIVILLCNSAYILENEPYLSACFRVRRDQSAILTNKTKYFIPKCKKL